MERFVLQRLVLEGLELCKGSLERSHHAMETFLIPLAARW
jgi:hypothetical protein